MQKRIRRMISISIVSAACFALPAIASAQSKTAEPTTGPTISPESQTKRSPAADKNGATNRKDPPSDRKQDSPTTPSEQAPTK